MNTRDSRICEKILFEIAVMNDLMAGVSATDFLYDERTARAVCMTLINIGELVKNLTLELKEDHREIPWRAISGMRDMTAHKYQTLRKADVYKTCAEDIPVFEKQLRQMISEE